MEMVYMLPFWGKQRVCHVAKVLCAVKPPVVPLHQVEKLQEYSVETGCRLLLSGKHWVCCGARVYFVVKLLAPPGFEW